MPTLTQPDVAADVIDAVRDRFAEFFVDEVVHVDLVGATFRTVVATRVLVGADEFLFLGVDRDHRVAGGLKGFDLRVDVFELSVPDDMMAAFQALQIKASGRIWYLSRNYLKIG